MKKIHIRATLLILLSILLGKELHAQGNNPVSNVHTSKQGYVITTQGDTLQGTVSKVEVTFIKFKRKSGGKTEKFYSPQIKEFKKGDKIFATKELPYNGLPLFLEVVETGSISLYRYDINDKSNPILSPSNPGGTFTMNGNYIPPIQHLPYNDRNIIKLYASKDNGPLVEIQATKNNTSSQRQRNEAFEELISDNPELLHEYNSSFLNFVNLRSLVKKYNKSSLVRN